MGNDKGKSTRRRLARLQRRHTRLVTRILTLEEAHGYGPSVDDLTAINDRIDEISARAQRSDLLANHRIDSVVHRLNSGYRDEAYRTIISRIESLEKSADPATRAAIARIESEWKVEGLKYSNDMRRLSGRVTDLAEQVARMSVKPPVIAVEHTSGGGTTLYHALEERAKDEIRELIREESRYLLCRITELDQQLAAQVERNRAVDADLALVRDALCPPQGLSQGPRFGDAAEAVFARACQEAETRESLSPGWCVCPSRESLIPMILDGITRCPNCCKRLPASSASRLVERLGQYADHLRQTREALRSAVDEIAAPVSWWGDDTNLADVISKVLMPAVRARIGVMENDLRTAHAACAETERGRSALLHENRNLRRGHERVKPSWVVNDLGELGVKIGDGDAEWQPLPRHEAEDAGTRAEWDAIPRYPRPSTEDEEPSR